MIARRRLIFAAAAAQYAPQVTVYKHPACGCCGEWVKHMQANGFRVEAQDVADVWRMLRARPALKGLAVPGLVAGTPGMEQGPPQRYATIAFDGRGTRVFARH
jgi:hypothetical protein